jgi:hypothetical protein
LIAGLIGSGLDDTNALDEHLRELFAILSTRHEAIRSLWVDYDLTLQCVGYFKYGSHGFHLSREHVRKAAQLGLSLDLDFYFVGGHRDEI